MDFLHLILELNNFVFWDTIGVQIDYGYPFAALGHDMQVN
jgi:hypothetical protein